MKYSCDALKERYHKLNRKPDIYDIDAVIEFEIHGNKITWACHPYDVFDWFRAVLKSGYKDKAYYYESDMGDGFCISLSFGCQAVDLVTDEVHLKISEQDLYTLVGLLRKTILNILAEWYDSDEINALKNIYLRDD